jgi:DNA (cytosine-5)-methyltransferase 1
MKYFSMFSGIGGFEKGIEQAYELQQVGVKPEDSPDPAGGTPQHTEYPLCIGYSEIDKYACQVYSKHYPEHKNYEDCTTIDPTQLPDFDLLVGGFPCQAFSIAGKRRGFEDTRGTLFFDVAKILREKRPRNFILENVKGLLSHDNGNTFKTIISALAELGYSVEWQVLNSKNFGVPQNRERVYMVGHLGGFGGRQVFPIRETNPKNLQQVVGGSQGNRVYDPDGIAVTQASQAGGLGAKTGLYQVPVKVDMAGGEIYEADTAGTLQSRDYKGFHNYQHNNAVAVPLKYLERNQKNFSGEHSFTVDTVNSGGVMTDYKIRRLTPTECERLQGFPDGWTEYGFSGEYRTDEMGLGFRQLSKISDTQRYKCCGNTVTVNVVQAVVTRLFQHN